jgi:putative ABC transport system substrate-binding protein
MSYGINTVDVFRKIGKQVGRILNGESPAELPVQAPTNYELILKLRTAATLSILMPPVLLSRADMLIE